MVDKVPDPLKKRQEQIRRWEASETNRESKTRKPSSRIRFPSDCIFLSACSAGDLEEVSLLLSDPATNINTASVDGLTALHQAVINEDVDVVRFLVERRININFADKGGWTALHAAAQNGYLDIAKLLVDNGANLDIVNVDCDLPSDLAKDLQVKMYLKRVMQEKGIDEDKVRKREELEMLTEANDWLEMKRTNPIDQMETVVLYKNLPLADSISNDQSDDSTLSSQFPLVDSRNGVTVLHVAASRGYISVIKVLLEGGMDINMRDVDDWTALHAAAHWGQTEVCQLLMKNKADSALKNKNGETALDVSDASLTNLLQQLIEQQKHMQDDESVIRISGPSKSNRKSSISRLSFGFRNDIMRKSYDEERRLSVQALAAISNENSNPAINTTNLQIRPKIDERKDVHMDPLVEIKKSQVREIGIVFEEDDSKNPNDSCIYHEVSNQNITEVNYHEKATTNKSNIDEEFFDSNSLKNADVNYANFTKLSDEVNYATYSKLSDKVYAEKLKSSNHKVEYGGDEVKICGKAIMDSKCTDGLINTAENVKLEKQESRELCSSDEQYSSQDDEATQTNHEFLIDNRDSSIVNKESERQRSLDVGVEMRQRRTIATRSLYDKNRIDDLNTNVDLDLSRRSEDPSTWRMAFRQSSGADWSDSNLKSTSQKRESSNLTNRFLEFSNSTNRAEDDFKSTNQDVDISQSINQDVDISQSINQDVDNQSTNQDVDNQSTNQGDDNIDKTNLRNSSLERENAVNVHLPFLRPETAAALANIAQEHRKSLESPKEGNEMERKTRAKKARESRRSTGKVNKEDLIKAESFNSNLKPTSSITSTSKPMYGCLPKPDSSSKLTNSVSPNLPRAESNLKLTSSLLRRVESNSKSANSVNRTDSSGYRSSDELPKREINSEEVEVLMQKALQKRLDKKLSTSSPADVTPTTESSNVGVCTASNTCDGPTQTSTMHSTVSSAIYAKPPVNYTSVQIMDNTSSSSYTTALSDNNSNMYSTVQSINSIILSSDCEILPKNPVDSIDSANFLKSPNIYSENVVLEDTINVYTTKSNIKNFSLEPIISNLSQIKDDATLDIEVDPTNNVNMKMYSEVGPSLYTSKNMGSYTKLQTSENIPMNSDVTKSYTKMPNVSANISQIVDSKIKNVATSHPNLEFSGIIDSPIAKNYSVLQTNLELPVDKVPSTVQSNTETTATDNTFTKKKKVPTATLR